MKPADLDPHIFSYAQLSFIRSPLAQSVTHLTADPEVASLIPAQSHTFMEIDHGSADSRRVVVR